MSIADLGTKEAADTVRRFLPEALYLFGSFFRRKGRKFAAISENGTLFRRVSLTISLAIICGLSTYVLNLLDPLNGLEGIMAPSERAIWSVLVPMIIVFPLYGLMPRGEATFGLSTFANLALVTCAVLTIFPGIISLAGANASSLASDTRLLKQGHAGGTAIHEIYCGTFQDRAALSVTMRELERNSQLTMEQGRLLVENGRQLIESRRRLDRAGNALMRAGGPDHASSQLMTEFMTAMRDGLTIMERGLAIHERGLALQREGISIMDRSFDIEDRIVTAQYRLFGRYPVATAFLVVAIFVGVLFWVFSAVIAWQLVVTPQQMRRRRIFHGVAVVTLFIVAVVGTGLLRTGLLEALIVEPPSREMIEAQLHSQFQIAAPMCGNLNSHGLW